MSPEKPRAVLIDYNIGSALLGVTLVGSQVGLQLIQPNIMPAILFAA